MNNIEYYGVDAVLRCKKSPEYQNGLKNWLQKPISFSNCVGSVSYLDFITNSFLEAYLSLHVIYGINFVASEFFFKTNDRNDVKVLIFSVFSGVVIGVRSVMEKYCPSNKAEDYQSVCPAFVHQTIEIGTNCPEGYESIGVYSLENGYNLTQCVGIITDAVATGA